MSQPYRQYHINNSVINLYFDSILNSKADVIVNSTSNKVGFSSSLGDKLLALVGEQLRTDIAKVVPVNIGSVIVSTAGPLPQKCLFNIVWGNELPKGSGNKEVEDIQEYILTHSIRRCFALMRTLELNSIAFPCLGTGNLRIPFEKAARCMAKNICKILKSTSKPLTIEVYLFEIPGQKEKIDFLPFFEWFASFSHGAPRDIETVEEPKEIVVNEAEIRENINNMNNSSKADIFISYSRKDTESAMVICSLLNKLGKSYWIDIDGIYSGDNFKELIVKAIKNAKIVLFLSSENSNSSPNVAKEIGIADKYGKIIIPVKLDDAPFNPKMDYDLSSIDAISFNRADEKSVNRLRNAILGQIEMSRQLEDLSLLRRKL